MVFNIVILTAIVGLAPVLGILFSEMSDERFNFQATVFKSITVSLSLIVFLLALFRITQVVQKIKGAFPNR